MNNLLTEFKAFIMQGHVVELAVAVVIGVAFKTVVDSLVADLVMPVIAMIGGEPNFSALDFEINNALFRYGAFITTVISFVIVAAAIFFLVVKPMNMLQERMKKEEEEKPEETPADILLLREIRDALKARG